MLSTCLSIWLQLCVRTWVSCSCFACLLDGLKYVNILSVLEGMTYQNFGKGSMQRTHQDCCRYYVNVMDGLEIYKHLSVLEGMKSWQKLDAANASGLLLVPAFCVCVCSYTQAARKSGLHVNISCQNLGTRVWPKHLACSPTVTSACRASPRA